MLRTLLTSAVVLTYLQVNTWAACNTPHIQKDMNYANARPTLLNDWFPAQNLPRGGYNEADLKVIISCMLSKDVCNKYPEIETCSNKTGCLMWFTDFHQNWLRLETHGDIRSGSATVTGFAVWCNPRRVSPTTVLASQRCASPSGGQCGPPGRGSVARQPIHPALSKPWRFQASVVQPSKRVDQPIGAAARPLPAFASIALARRPKTQPPATPGPGNLLSLVKGPWPRLSAASAGSASVRVFTPPAKAPFRAKAAYVRSKSDDRYGGQSPHGGRGSVFDAGTVAQNRSGSRTSTVQMP